MGLILRSSSQPAPTSLNIADNGLSAFMNVDVLDRNFLLPCYTTATGLLLFGITCRCVLSSERSAGASAAMQAPLQVSRPSIRSASATVHDASLSQALSPFFANSSAVSPKKSPVREAGILSVLRLISPPVVLWSATASTRSSSR